MSTFEELRRLTHVLARDLSQHTGVAYPIVHNLIQYSRCLSHAKTPEHIDELVFIAQMGLSFGITSVLHCKLMFRALLHPHKNLVRMDDYVRLICIFLSPKLDLKIDFVFSVYDYTQVNQIERKTMHYLLKPSIVSSGDESDPEEALKELINLVLSVFDSDNDGKISLEEFRQHVKANILYIQLLGQVLPNDDDLAEFLCKIKYKTPLEVRALFEHERVRSLSEPLFKKDTLLKSLYPVVLDMP